jgi:hypothetical protein
MSHGISKTIPKSKGLEEVDSLYEVVGEYEFHTAGSPSNLEVGDYVYTIFDDELVGRCEIIRMEGGAVNPNSGRPRTLVYVRTPGERLDQPVPMKGHRGTRYYEGEAWPAR